MYSINMPKIEETVSIGNDIIYFQVLNISTTDSENKETHQKEIRLKLTPVSLEYSHHYKDSLVFAIRIFNKSISLRIEYGKSERI